MADSSIYPECNACMADYDKMYTQFVISDGYYKIKRATIRVHLYFRPQTSTPHNHFLSSNAELLLLKIRKKVITLLHCIFAPTDLARPKPLCHHKRKRTFFIVEERAWGSVQNINNGNHFHKDTTWRPSLKNVCILLVIINEFCFSQNISAVFYFGN